MHDGSLATLEDVIEFYDAGGRPNPNLSPFIRPLFLSDYEKAALVLFLQTLTDQQYDPIPMPQETPSTAMTRTHAKQEFKHTLTIFRQIDYLGAMPTVQAKPVKVSDKAKEMLRFELDNEADTIRNYRERVRQCEAMGEFAIAEHIREILLGEQEQLIDLATALGEEAPDLSKPAA